MTKNKHSFRGRRRPTQDSERRPPSSAGAGVWLYGFHSVEAALANPLRRCRRLLLTAEAERAHGPRLRAARADGPAGTVVERDVIERMLPGAIHQGVALEADPLPDLTIEDLCEMAKAQPDICLVILDQVTDPHNVGAVLRSADAFGAAAVVVPERHAPSATATLAKAASGALERMSLVRVTNLARAMVALKQAGVWFIGLDAGAKTMLKDADLSGRIALVLGAEGEGLRRLTRESCDHLALIPINRQIGSLNVSNAAAIALYEWTQRR